MLHKALLPFESLDEIRISTKQLKGVTQYFPVVLFIMLHMVVLTFESVDEVMNGTFQTRKPVVYQRRAFTGWSYTVVGT